MNVIIDTALGHSKGPLPLVQVQSFGPLHPQLLVPHPQPMVMITTGGDEEEEEEGRQRIYKEERRVPTLLSRQAEAMEGTGKQGDDVIRPPVKNYACKRLAGSFLCCLDQILFWRKSFWDKSWAAASVPSHAIGGVNLARELITILPRFKLLYIKTQRQHIECESLFNGPMLLSVLITLTESRAMVGGSIDVSLLM
ncbi:hypothetical protein TESG_08518 [Trichophyton tonsurans CBS 112818]|uniref:Uncharacterized protein n=1 Tax=Trichophyton tonsurans (strain CBS 112818) TaxID=647933 RepID=F2S2N3_TRIT1|nr:hypothetical protein TESG_08518 [Trichophyton tonsurans CBS 112818]